MNIIICDLVKRLSVIEVKKNQFVKLLDDIIIAHTYKMFEDVVWL